jgi:hypothetical protein
VERLKESAMPKHAETETLLWEKKRTTKNEMAG